jgi:hypothetical protein
MDTQTQQANEAYLTDLYGPDYAERQSVRNINQTSQKPVMRTEGDYTVTAGPTQGSGIVWRTKDLAALENHPMFLIDPTLDHNTHAVAMVYWLPNGIVELETNEFTVERDTLAEALDFMENDRDWKKNNA